MPYGPFPIAGSRPPSTLKTEYPALLLRAAGAGRANGLVCTTGPNLGSVYPRETAKRETNRFVCKNHTARRARFEIETARFESGTGFFVHTEEVTGSNPVSPISQFGEACLFPQVQARLFFRLSSRPERRCPDRATVVRRRRDRTGLAFQQTAPRYPYARHANHRSELLANSTVSPFVVAIHTSRLYTTSRKAPKHRTAELRARQIQETEPHRRIRSAGAQGGQRCGARATIGTFYAGVTLSPWQACGCLEKCACQLQSGQ